MRLHLRVHDGREGIFTLHHAIRPGERGLRVPFADLEMLICIMPFAMHIGQHEVIHQPLMQHGRGKVFGLPDIQHKGELFIFDFNLFQRAQGFALAARHHRGYRLAHKTHFFLGDRILVAHSHPKGAGHIPACYDPHHTRHSRRLRRIHVQYPGVGMGGAQHLDMQQVRELHIRCILGRARYFFYAIHPFGTGAYGLKCHTIYLTRASAGAIGRRPAR